MAVVSTSVPPPELSGEPHNAYALACQRRTLPPDPAYLTWLTRSIADSDYGALPEPALVRRHRGWHEHRLRIWAALVESRVALSRIRRFHDCGLTAFVQRSLDHPERYRVVLETCRDRWCAPCAAERRGLIVGHLQEHMRGGEHRFITLSLKSTDQPLADQLDRLSKCFRRLRQRKLWKTRVDGGLAGFEVTWNGETRRWHPHLHAIIHGRYIRHAPLSAAWRDVTGDSFIVDIRKIRHVDRVAAYVAKYATKPLPASLQRDRARLLEAVAAFTHRRTFIQFGDWAKHSFTRRPDTGEWQTLGFLAEVLLDNDLPRELLQLISRTFDGIADGLTMAEFTWLPPPNPGDHA